MKKDLLDTFIQRYYLGGLVSKVKWKYNAKDKTLHTRATADTHNFIADVIAKDFTEFGTDDLVLCIADTEKFKKMTGIFEEEFQVEISKSGDRVLGINMFNADCQSYCSAADPSAIDPVPKNLQDIPEYHVVVPITEEFAAQFLKAQSALKDVKTFSVGMNKKGVFEVVVGYSTSNSNRIRLTPKTDATKNKVDVAVTYNISYIAEVLRANKDIPGGEIAFNNGGIAKMQFKNDNYECVYYQFANKKA